MTGNQPAGGMQRQRRARKDVRSKSVPIKNIIITTRTTMKTAILLSIVAAAQAFTVPPLTVRSVRLLDRLRCV